MKKVLTTAGMLIAAGAVLMFAAIAIGGFNMERFNTERYAQTLYQVDEPFHSIEIRGVDCDVYLAYDQKGPCRVESTESDHILTEVHVKNGTLTITRKDDHPWYQRIGFWWTGGESAQVNVYLPESAYDDLLIYTVSGDIHIPDDFAFETMEAHSTSGDITTQAGVSDGLDVQTVSGDIAASSVAGPVSAETTSGQIVLEGVSAEALTATTISGDIRLNGVTADGQAVLTTTSGDIRLADFDADSMEVSTISGNVTGTLLTAKNFQTNTTSGSITVPPSDRAAGSCDIKTTSGDVSLTIKDE